MGACTSSTSAVSKNASQQPSSLVTNVSNPAADPMDSIPHTLNARYTLGEVLGEGGFSVVKLGVSKFDNNNKVAVKIVQRSGLSAQDETMLRNEVKILSSLKHPNVVRALDFFEEKDVFYVVMEYLNGGELFDRIVQKSFYNEKEARDLVLTLLKTIKYLHDKHIVHRDLKPENLLLTGPEEDADVKIADFGFAVIADGFSVTSQCGTPNYMAPEILENKAYGAPVDMWSFGVILYILLGGYPPFHDDNQRVMFRKITRGEFHFHDEYWSTVSEEAKDLIRGLLTVDMKQRLTVDQALMHPWVQAADELLAARNLDANLATLKKYQAQRRLRAGVKAVMAINRMQKLIGSNSNGSNSTDNANTNSTE